MVMSLRTVVHALALQIMAKLGASQLSQIIESDSRVVVSWCTSSSRRLCLADALAKEGRIILPDYNEGTVVAAGVCLVRCVFGASAALLSWAWLWNSSPYPPPAFPPPPSVVYNHIHHSPSPPPGYQGYYYEGYPSPPPGPQPPPLLLGIIIIITMVALPS
ncbi:hypothetical protein V6N12_012389 [Hibiscus sabdariffa]|uniref:Uncharacterized protein n=1 Tax=Hibiscus sabdariffa TaxID=183260 RepID=A0ABR2CIP2_9ROSI